MGGGPVDVGQTAITVLSQKQPIPTAQITLFAFEDNNPTNGQADLPEERGLAGFEVVVTESGGRYGQVGGMMMPDAFGNPLGTTYQLDVNGQPVLDPDGNPIVDMMGTGQIFTDANGEAIVKYVQAGKYDMQLVPPKGEGWQQTTTLEGTQPIEAFVKPNEPRYFMEFGPPGYHSEFGFVKKTNDATALTGSAKITGQIVDMHMSRPPNYTMYNGAPFKYTIPWVALNDLSAGIGKAIYVQPTDALGNFTIPKVKPGVYQLNVFDTNLDVIIAQNNVTVPTVGDVALGPVPVFPWFTRLESYVFYDTNQNGFRDPGEPGIPDQNMNIRFRDGSIYQSFVTNDEGYASFDEVFPFFNWQIAEVDYARFKATGVTVTVDNGGQIVKDPAWTKDWTWGGQLNPQMQPDPNNPGQTLPYRTEQGPSLLEGFQGFVGQTSVMEWGKAAYGPGENGGIVGIVYYDVTRAEEDPQYAAAEKWEPGIPRVVVNLYQSDANGVIQDLDHDGTVTLCDVDNYPFGNFPGVEDIDRNGNHAFDPGDTIQISKTDSWDDQAPTGCVGDIFYSHGVPTDCYDGLRNFNQVRSAVFDGGYMFSSYHPGGIASGSLEVSGLPADQNYVVEVVQPRSPIDGKPVYEIYKEEDKNVTFGQSYIPSTMLVPPRCVGDPHTVPPEYSLFPGQPTPFAGQTRPMSDRKLVQLHQGQNANCDFFMFTDVPISAHIVGMILDDSSNEFDPQSPVFGEKYAPPWLPISIRDWAGNEIARTYADEWGTYNALVPSTYDINRPLPSGVGPNMVTVVLNDPGPIPDPAHPGQFITDPFFNKQYSQFAYTLQYMPGVTTYLDTPVVPVGAFTGPGQFPLDCEYPDGTPDIQQVSGPGGGPYVSATGQSITIIAEGPTQVPNPQYDGIDGSHPKNIIRDYGFGNTTGTVTIGGVALQNVRWSNLSISGNVAPGTQTGQLVVKRGDNGLSTVTGITMTVGGPVRRVLPGQPIQPVIDASNPGDLVLVPPGVHSELVIMWKPVKLQGWGAGSTSIKATKVPAEILQNWRTKIASLINGNWVTLLPPQAAEAAPARRWSRPSCSMRKARRSSCWPRTSRPRTADSDPSETPPPGSTSATPASTA